MKPAGLLFESLSTPAAKASIGPKDAKILLRMETPLKESLNMRIAQVIFAGSIAGAVALATPALANDTDSQTRAEAPTTSSPCQAYQMGPDGVWQQKPCQEAGAAAQAPRRSAAHSGGGVSETQTR